MVKSARAKLRRRQRKLPAQPSLPASEATAEAKVAAPETPYDEPAVPKAEPAVPVERPPPAVGPEQESDPCGLADEAITPASDLH